ncbi:MAG TPA: phenylalanine--tRNA ligase beta subunit-related protein [Candidatus Cybelea sp.]|nr:phenylalanine--tRNA ligase beta subunit-related protein [Candidatus Cybelea sp.]
MEFAIAPEVAARFPDIEVHAIRARGLRAAASQLDHVRRLRDAVAGVLALGLDREKLAAFPPIAVWREAYAKLNVRPSQFRASIESLTRRALGGADLALPIPAVNLYNAVSLGTLAPMGAYDMAKLPSLPMRLRFATPDIDRFLPLGGKPEDFPLNPDLVVYAAGDMVLCWGFNCRDHRETGLDAQSDDIVFFSEAVDAEGGIRSGNAIGGIRSRLAAIGVECSDPVVANRAQPTFSL